MNVVERIKQFCLKSVNFPGLRSLLIFYDLKRRLTRTTCKSLQETYKMSCQDVLPKRLAKTHAKILQDSYKISKLLSPGLLHFYNLMQMTELCHEIDKFLIIEKSISVLVHLCHEDINVILLNVFSQVVHHKLQLSRRHQTWQ